jgi:hypothetical protein
MLPSWVTLVELPDAPAFAAATSFVCASAVPPQDSATDEITAQYNLRCRFLLFVKLLIEFIFFSNQGPHEWRACQSKRNYCE